MAQNTGVNLYDEENAISFIKQKINLELKSRLQEDDYYHLLDLITGYYEDRGLLDEEESENEEEVFIDEEEIANYIVQKAQKEGLSCQLTAEEALSIVQAECDYCEQLGLMN